ncbi:MAG: site-specific DNA-methyltransferase [Elusimicrobiota bacterium]|jgi:DNA modification methylase|nr:site-specific DNA-methyltransferase [Elusimicrobiota bacterium]
MVNNANELSGKEWLQNSFSIWRGLSKTPEEKFLKHPASFPISLCEKVIKTFSPKSGKILDPFNGIGSTTKACENLNREVVGIDLSEDFCEIARRRISNKKNIKIIANNNIAELTKQPENYFNLCFTSPPYWDILNMNRSVDNKKNIKSYSNKTDDIGNINDYSVFLNKLEDIFSQVHRVLKKNAYCVVNVMDIRKKSIFYPLHSDIANIMQKIGYIYDDIIIWDRQNDYNNMRPLGYPFKFRVNKVHEYLMIFMK